MGRQGRRALARAPWDDVSLARSPHGVAVVTALPTALAHPALPLPPLAHPSGPALPAHPALPTGAAPAPGETGKVRVTKRRLPQICLSPKFCLLDRTDDQRLAYQNDNRQNRNVKHPNAMRETLFFWGASKRVTSELARF